MVELVVNTDGTVAPSSVVIVDSSHTAYDQVALVMAASALFWPGCKGANAVRVRVHQPFQLKTRRED
jgi:outer membrane biosynthesis protein TonB